MSQFIDIYKPVGHGVMDGGTWTPQALTRPMGLAYLQTGVVEFWGQWGDQYASPVRVWVMA